MPIIYWLLRQLMDSPDFVARYRGNGAVWGPSSVHGGQSNFLSFWRKFATSERKTFERQLPARTALLAWNLRISGMMTAMWNGLCENKVLEI